MDNLPEQIKPKNFNPENSPAREAYRLLNASTPLELSNRYTEEDQKLMRAGTWDYNNSLLIVNVIKNILETLNPQELTEEEGEWRQEILWFWYHHAISCAVWRYKDILTAQKYVAKAIQLQPADHPNKITKLLDLLVNNKLEEAHKWADSITEEPEKSTALAVIEEWSK